MVKFNWFNHTGTQKLYRRQFKQAIKRYGVPCIYVHKSTSLVDSLYGEDVALAYRKTSPLKLYLESFDFYDGDHQQFSAFLSELRDRMRFKVEIEDFEKYTGKKFPEEGDLVVFELGEHLSKVNSNNKTYEIFEIKGVEERSDFYALGTFFSYVLECDRFEYNHERFNTSIPLIDALNQITDNKTVNDSQGDNTLIDELDAGGVEAFNSVTGKVENSSHPITEQNDCDPLKVEKNQPTSSDWDPNNPYMNKE